MADIVEQMEQHLNEQGAEMTVLKIILQGLVARIIIADPAFSEEQLEQMKTDALGALGRTPMNPENSATAEQRVATLTVQHTERFFRELAAAVSAMRNRFGQSGRN